MKSRMGKGRCKGECTGTVKSKADEGFIRTGAFDGNG